MARTRTLLQLRTSVRDQADLQSLTLRHPDAQINTFINSEIQALREQISAVGISHYLTSATGNLTAGVSTGFPYRVLDLSALSPGVVRVFGLDIQLTNQRWQALRAVDFSERTQFQPELGSTSAGTVPEAWANVTTYTLAILPAPGYAVPYRVYYLPVLADLAADGDTFDGIAGFEDAVVYGACLRCVSRDQHAEVFSILQAERERHWQRILQNCSKVSAAGAVFVRRDTMGRRRRFNSWSW